MLHEVKRRAAEPGAGEPRTVDTGCCARIFAKRVEFGNRNLVVVAQTRVPGTKKFAYAFEAFRVAAAQGLDALVDPCVFTDNVTKPAKQDGVESARKVCE